jgi:hypothetical protein
MRIKRLFDLNEARDEIIQQLDCSNTYLPNFISNYMRGSLVIPDKPGTTDHSGVIGKTVLVNT